MAYLNKRNFIGIDMSEEYINDICIPRLKDYGWNPNNHQYNNKGYSVEEQHIKLSDLYKVKGYWRKNY